jgi:hypothetical protein
VTIQPTETTLEHALAALDFNPDVECDHHQCNRTATWYTTHQCCGFTYPVCDRCKNVMLAYLILTPKAQCSECGARSPHGLAKVCFTPAA